jgi:hypothetical protein
MRLPIRVDEIPDYLLPHLQDWITEARQLNAERLRLATPPPVKP